MTGSQIKTTLSKIVDEMVADNNPQALDDDLADIQNNPEERDEAISQLIRMIENYREDL